MVPDTTTPPPFLVAPDTHVIAEHFPADGAVLPIASMVITGREPVVVDTGTALNRDRWFEALGTVVDPADVRWIFLSHDDHDHVGNLVELMDLAPRATLVTTWFSVERLAGDLHLPPERMRWVRSGESFDAGDRTLVALRPPVFDAPTTRGLFDARTGVYWAGDAFAALAPEPMPSAADVPEAMWEETFLHLNRLVAPWFGIADAARFAATVDAVEALGATAIASGHTPTLTGERLVRAFDLLRALPGMDEAEEPGQPELEALLAAAQASVLVPPADPILSADGAASTVAA